MKRKLFLHVGPHKTGTTLIQKVCLDNQQALLSGGVFYPKNYVRIFGHHLIRDLIKGRQLSESDSNFFKEIDSDILLSSEDFISFSIKDFEYIKTFFSDFDVHVIYSWRRASLKMYSIWQELIKHGQSVSFFEFYHNHLARPAQSYMLSADLQVERFVKVFGIKKVHLIDYDKAAKDKNLLELFFSIINCKYSKEYLEKSESKVSNNRSLNPFDTETIRILNKIMSSKYGMHGNDVREAYLDHYSELDITELHQIMQTQVTSLPVGNYFIDKKTERVMYSKFKENFINFEQAQYTSSITLIQDSWLMNSEAITLINNLADRIHERSKSV
ncbi:hypothetical protein [Pseudoalteromonas agarivorans]|jgi:hypothetical protein|uniref:Sulfotransferase domain-containing protein n=1 Tax=Pseudoalteromonas agarivorans TaxID=176102 RepID=A0AAD0TWA2_9GAMM|nr:hypothetical protein [Pseudoalteromonas agarivorans]AYM85597.1 hypothetical protein D9T18_02240 [Pseudoalteromonas agarivorans]